MENSLDGPIIITIAGWLVILVSLLLSRVAASMRTLIDRPNRRSSHEYATSKAGGAAILGAWLLGVFVLGAFSFLPDVAGAVLRLGILGMMAFAVGFVDDYSGLSPLPKAAGQGLVIALFCVLFAPLTQAPVPGAGLVSLGMVSTMITALWIFGFMNTFNFMDGVNGIAGTAAIIVLTSFGAVAALAQAPILAAAALFLAIAIFGFLPNNVRRKNLFMGDNGSQFISFMIAIFGIIAANWTGGKISALFMPMAFLPFIFDVVFTVGHRLIRGRNVLVAHREHLYQLVLRQGSSHEKVALIYSILTMVASGFAILMLLAPPAWQWAFPLGGAALMTVFAERVYSRAVNTGLLETSTEEETRGDGVAAG